MNANEKAALWDAGYSKERAKAEADKRTGQASATRWLVPNFRLPPGHPLATRLKQAIVNGEDTEAIWKEYVQA